MISVAFAMLIAATPLDLTIEEALSCGTFERQSHLYEPGCDRLVCTDANGRPDLPAEETFRSPGGFFKIHYTMKGPNGLLPVDQDENGIPDYVDKVAAAFDEALEAFRKLGFDDPMPDNGLGGDDRTDIYLSWLAGFGGVAYPDLDAFHTKPSPRPERPFAVPSYLAINPIQHAAFNTLLPDWMGDLLLRQVSTHELHHAVQMGYAWRGYDDGAADEASWVYEGMSVMLEQSLLELPRKFPFVTDFRYGVRYRYPFYTLLQPEVSRFGYSNGLFFTSLLQDMGGVATGYPAFWSALALSTEVHTENRVNAALQAANLGTLREAYRRFTLRALFLGAQDDGLHFQDGYRYHAPGGAVRTDAITTSGAFTTLPLEKYGNAYFEVPHPGPGGLWLVKPAQASAEWDWVRQYEDCSTSVTALDPLRTADFLPTGSQTLRGWLVIRHLTASRHSYPFEISLPSPAVRTFQDQVTLLEAPVTAAVGSVFTPIALRTRSDCRREDVTDDAVWSFEPAGAATRSAAGSVTSLRPGRVTLQASYGEDVTQVSWVVVPGARQESRARKGGGCSSAGKGEESFLLTLCLAFAFLLCKQVRGRVPKTLNS